MGLWGCVKRERKASGRHLGLGLCDIDKVLFVVVGQADGISLGQAGVPPQRAFQHRPGVADVQKVLCSEMNV